MVDPEEYKARQQYIDEMEALCEQSLPYEIIEDFESESLFRYAIQKIALDAAGVDIESFPSAAEASRQNIKRLELIFSSYFAEDKVDPREFFTGCTDVRSKIARLTEMTEGQLLQIVDEMSLDYTIRRYAMSLLEGDLKDLNEILNQSLGKPLERSMTVTQSYSAIENLSTEELRALAYPSQEEKEDNG